MIIIIIVISIMIIIITTIFVSVKMLLGNCFYGNKYK